MCAHRTLLHHHAPILWSRLFNPCSAAANNFFASSTATRATCLFCCLFKLAAAIASNPHPNPTSPRTQSHFIVHRSHPFHFLLRVHFFSHFSSHCCGRVCARSTVCFSSCALSALSFRARCLRLGVNRRFAIFSFFWIVAITSLSVLHGCTPARRRRCLFR